MLEIRLLGTFDLHQAGKPIIISSRPVQSLLAYLVLHAGKTHRREKLAGLLWPDSLEETARDNLRHALWRLRKALSSNSSTQSKASPRVDYLITDDISIGFDATADYWLDVSQMEALSDRALIKELSATLTVYQGELLPGFYDDWVVLEREHIYAIFEHHMARLMVLLENERRWLDIFDWAERWIKLGQKPEPAYRALMTAHAAKGDMSKVAATYERCVNSLQEYGIEPSKQTQELYIQLKSGKKSLEPSPVNLKRIEREVSWNIPVPLTSFIGRENELKEIARLLAASRLLTFTGPGGVGKTRLAIQTATASSETFKDGVVWVGLVGLSDPNLIPQEICQALQLREVSTDHPIDTLKSFLQSKELLLILDNCEHLIRACAYYAEQLLAACPLVKILATSTEALGLFNEVVWQVPSLPFPGLQTPFSPTELRAFASIALFTERATNAKPGFALDESNATSVAQICHRLDGIPLAIELAAARIKLMSVDEIAARLDDRFSLLTAGSRTAVSRHQTLRAAIDWSYDLLAKPEQVLLRRLSVFAGGFTLEAAETICNEGMDRVDILEQLGRLVNKSFVIVETGALVGETRYRLLESIRQYALEKLVETGEASEMRNRHLDYYLQLAETSEPIIFSIHSTEQFKRLDRELDNIRAAIKWATNNGRAAAALRMSAALVYFWFAYGHRASEWLDRIQQALTKPESRERTLARAKALNGIGFMYWADIYPADKRSELEEALSIGRELGDNWNTATALRNLGLIENIQGNYQQARTFLEESLAIWREMGADGKMGGSWTLIFLGDGALSQGQPDLARSTYEEAETILREIGDVNFLAYLLRRLSQLAWREGDYSTALSLCGESLALNRQVGDTRGILACLAAFAVLATMQGKFERAARLMSAVDSQLSALSIRLLYIDRMEFESSISLLRANVEEKTVDTWWKTGQDLSLEQTTALALAEIE